MKKLLTFIFVWVFALITLYGCSNNKWNIETFEIKIEKASEELQNLQTSAATSVNTYVVARMYLEKLLAYDIENGNMEEYSQLVDDTTKAFEVSESESAALIEVADNYKWEDKIIVSLNNKELINFVIPKVYAAENNNARTWAEAITAIYDKAPYWKGVKTLAEQLNIDSKRAYKQLQMAQEILKSDAYSDFGDYANNCYKVAKTLKTAWSAAQLYISVATAWGTAWFAGVMEKWWIIINGINTVCEVWSLWSVIIVWEDNKVSAAFDRVEEAVAPIWSVIWFYGVWSADYAEHLAANLTDAFSYIAWTIQDWVEEGKVLGWVFKEKNWQIKFTLFETMFGIWWDNEDKAKMKEFEDKLELSQEEKDEIAAMFTEDDYDFEITTKVADEFIESHKAYNPNEEGWDHTEDILSVIESSNQDIEETKLEDKNESKEAEDFDVYWTYIFNDVNENAWIKPWEDDTAELIIEKISDTKIRASNLEEWEVVEIDYNPATHEARIPGGFLWLDLVLVFTKDSITYEIYNPETGEGNWIMKGYKK